MNINVHIERLILDGLPVTGSDGSIVQAAVETELARILAERGLAGVSGGSVPYLSAVPMTLGSDLKPAHFGHQIARAIHTGFESAPVTPRPHIFPGGRSE